MWFPHFIYACILQYVYTSFSRLQLIVSLVNQTNYKCQLDGLLQCGLLSVCPFGTHRLCSCAKRHKLAINQINSNLECQIIGHKFCLPSTLKVADLFENKSCHILNFTKIQYKNQSRFLEMAQFQIFGYKKHNQSLLTFSYQQSVLHKLENHLDAIIISKSYVVRNMVIIKMSLILMTLALLRIYFIYQ